MASIFGCVSAEGHKTAEISRAMFESLASRGGGAQAMYDDHQIMMGSRGEAEDVQQSLVMNPSKSLIAVIEGEIYNLAELHKLLGEEQFTRDSDQMYAAILGLYEKFGKDFPKYLNGIFAIALWDQAQKTMYLIRDHLGSRSLFYARNKQSLFFASTIQALLQTGLVDRELSLAGLNAYFASTAISSPNTLFTNIFCLRPGAMVIYANGECQEYEYWRSQRLQEDYTRKEEDFIEEVRALILDAIKIRANFGGKYGSLLSGGVDTGIIAATLANHQPDRRLAGFSIAFEETFYNDAALQQIMYTRYNIEPHVATLSPKEFAEILSKGAAHLDKPVNDNAFVGMYQAFALAKQAGYTSVFDGEAADELFFTGHAHGEKAFQKFLRIPFWLRRGIFGALLPSIPLGNSLWQKGQRLLYKMGLSNEERILTRLPCFYKHATPILLNPNAVVLPDPHAIGKRYLAESALQDPLNIYHYGLLKTFLPDDLLFKNERMASAHGLTNRTPFIDYRLVELAFTIPTPYKLTTPTEDDDGTKQVYKKAITGLIPDEILHRKKKRGFSQPSSVWYRRELKDFVHDTLLSQGSLCLDYINKPYLAQLVAEHVSGHTNHDYLLSSLLILELWLQTFVRSGD